MKLSKLQHSAESERVWDGVPLTNQCIFTEPVAHLVGDPAAGLQLAGLHLLQPHGAAEGPDGALLSLLLLIN